MKFSQLLVLLAMCGAAFAQVATQTTASVTPSSKPNIYFQIAPIYTVSVSAASGSTAPAGVVTVTIGGNVRGSCTLNTSTTATATCSFEDTKPSAQPNLPVGSTSATISFAPTDTTAFSASTNTVNFIVYALPVVSLTYNGAANDVSIGLPSGVTTLVATIDITSSGSSNAPAGTVSLTQTSPNPSAAAISCTVASASPYTCSLSVPQSYLVASQNYTLVATFIPSTNSQYGPDGSSSITLRVLATATTTGTTTTTGAATTTTTGPARTIIGYSSATIAVNFNGTCAANFSTTTSGLLAAAVSGINANYTGSVGTCTTNADGTFTVVLTITTSGNTVIPTDFLASFALAAPSFNALGLTYAGTVVLTNSVPVYASTTTTTTGTGSTTTTTTAAAGSTTTTTAAASTTAAATTTTAATATTAANTGASTNANTGASGTSSASAVVVGASALLVLAAML